MSAFAGNVLDTVLGFGEERYKKVRRWPPPPATCSTLCWDSERRDTRRCCGGRSTGNVPTLCWDQGGGIREGAAMSAFAGNVLDTVLGVGEEEYEKVRR